MAETNRMTADDRNDEKARNLLLAINGQEGSGEQAGDRTALSGEQSGESGRASASGEDGSGETIVEHYAENEREYRDDNVKDTTDTNEYTYSDSRGSGGGPQAAWHVYRHHIIPRTASSGL